MSITDTTASAGAPATATPRRRSFWTGRSEFALVVLLYLIAGLLTIGTATMNVQGEAVPGPRFFPVIVCVLLYATATVLAVHLLRHPHLPDTDPHPGHGDFSADMLKDLGHVTGERTDAHESGISPRWKSYSDWKTLGQIVGAAVIFIVLLKGVGWVLCAAFLFWVVSRALGSRRPVSDVGVALLFSSVIQLAFNAGLGLPLPPGFLEGLL
jgi:putative tricarboxylic transport membrane protein